MKRTNPRAKEAESDKEWTVLSQLTWSSTKKPNGTKVLVTMDSMDGCSVLPETQFVGTHLRMDIALALSVGGSFPHSELLKRGQFKIKSP